MTTASDSQHPIQQLEQLARDAAAKLTETFNAPDVLPFASKAIEMIEAHPSLQSDFEQAFLAMTPYAPSEFIQVCMHAFRWPTVKKEFEVRCRAAVMRNDWRAEPVYRHILDAFEPDWEDAQDFYLSYFKQRAHKQ